MSPRFVSLLMIAWMLQLMTIAYSASEELILWPAQSSLDPRAGESLDERGTPREPDRLIGQVRVPTLTALLPDPRRATGAAVVICPGGGYAKLVIDREGFAVADWLNSIGVAAFVLKYRLPDPRLPEPLDPLPLQDARRAIRIVRDLAKRWNIRPDRIGIFGASAGGHLASSVCTHFDAGTTTSTDPVERQSCRPDFAILLYPVITMNTQFAHSGSRINLLGEHPTSASLRHFSNELQVTSDTPPTFIALADDDQAVPPLNSIAYYLALHRAGVPAELHVYQHGLHGFCLLPDRTPANTWADRCAEWFVSSGLIQSKE